MTSQSTPPLTWPCYGLDSGGTRFAEHSAINRSNVSKLRPAWTFHTGDLSDGKNKPYSAFECTPIYVDHSLFVVSPFNRVFDLDPDTGKARWTFDPQVVKLRPQAIGPFACRGLSTWKNPKTGERTLFLATYDARLIALDAKTGQLRTHFGANGSISLRQGVGGVKLLNQYNETSAPAVVGDRIVVGSSIIDNTAVHMPSGLVRAFDVKTGRLDWAWEPLREPGQAGSGNAWSTISADEQRDMVFVPTGSASPDFCGITRPGDNLDADSIVALRASTGEKLWSFQVVRHDLWDYDVPAQPLLANVNGKPAVIAMTKMGHVFLLDRLTGKPLLPVEERDVPASDLPGEVAAERQIFPVLPKPLVPDRLIPWAIAKSGKDLLARRLSGVRQLGVFTPPSETGTLIFPGDLGGCNWSGGSYSATTDTLYVNTNSFATLVYMIPRSKLADAQSAYPGHEISAATGSPFAMRREWLEVPDYVPGNKPPWGVLHAIDMKTGKVRWEKPLGVLPQYKELDAAKDWGTPNLGGSFVTDTGLVFIAATIDPALRAFDADTGSVLWQATLPAGGQAAPMTYRSERTGRQYVVQCAGGHHGLGSVEGDSVVAFTIP